MTDESGDSCGGGEGNKQKTLIRLSLAGSAVESLGALDSATQNRPVLSGLRVVVAYHECGHFIGRIEWSLMNDVRTSLEHNENMLHINAFVEFAKTCERMVV